MSVNTAAILSSAVTTNIDFPGTPVTKGKEPYIPEGSQKRNLSLESTPSPSSAAKFDKRQRRSSGVFDENPPQIALAIMDTEPSDLSDIMALLHVTAKIDDLEKLAKQDELLRLQATVSSQAHEIQQLRDTMTSQAKRLQNLENTLGRNAAVSISASRTQPDAAVTRTNKHGGPHEVNIRSDDRRRNLVFEGLPLGTDVELEPYILQLCTELGIIAYPSDIDTITPMKRRDPTSRRPPQVLVSFEQLHVRSALLRLKSKLANIPKYATVFINPDEPIEVRRNKATFRKIAFKARQDGKTVLIRNDWMQIDDDVYYVADLDKIPDRYKPAPPTQSTTDQAEPEPGTNATEPNGASGGACPKIPTLPRTRPRVFSRIKIKLTDAGLTFSGPSAFLSHMYNCDFIYDKTPYTSVEQGLHHIHATHELEFEIAEAIMELYNAIDIKDAAKSLPDTEEWNEMAPGVIFKLNQAKYDQNPDLKQRLIETAPHPIVEASVTAKWGGGCLFGSDIYEQGQVPGRKLAGSQITKLRDDIIKDMEQHKMS